MNAAPTLCLALALCGLASGAGAYSLCDRAFEDPADLLRTVVREGSVVAHDDDQALRMVDRFHDLAWTFHKAGSPAPAVACQRLYRDGGGFHLQTEIACFGSQEACDRLKAGYDGQAATLEGLRSPR